MSEFYTRAQAPQQKNQLHYSPNLLNTLDHAIDNCFLCTIEYDSREKGVTTRDIEPMAVTYKEGKRNLVGYCHLRNEYRAFRLDRLNMIKLKKQHFTKRTDFNVAEFQDAPNGNNREVREED